MTETDLLTLLGALPDNDVNLPELVEQIRSGPGIIPFVGAGFSAPYNFPQWGAFMRETAKRARLVDEVEAHLSALEYEEAAELLQTRMKSGFQDMIEHYFGDKVLKGAEFAGAVALVPRITTGPVITTNFDRLLEKVFEHAGCPFPVTVWHEKAYAAVRALSRNRLLLLKLHGDWEFPGERILTLSEYREQYGRSKTKINFRLPLPETLALLVARPALFLGCSLKQDRTGRIIAQLAARMQAMRHFAILEYPETEAAYVARIGELADMNVRPVWYPPRQYAKIEAVLEYLADFVPEERRLVKPARVVIPAPPSTFIGRSRELAELKAAILKYPLVTVTGAPGAGKTRLAQEVARNLNDEFDAIWFVSLSQLGDPGAIPQRIAHVMGVEVQGRKPIDVIVAALNTGRQLVLIDNCERALEACAAIIRKLREECRDLRLLLTSRVVLAAAIAPWEEIEYRVPPLELPDPEDLPDLDELAKIDSVELLLERARPRSRAILTEETARDIVELCRRLDGIPLALELVAAQMETRDAKTVLADLDKRLGLETERENGPDDESDALRRAISVSYGLLATGEKGDRLCSLFRSLSVFHRGWTASAALQVCGEPGETEDELRDKMLAPLRRASLIETESAAGEIRYRYLDPIREFASGKLSRGDGASRFDARHARWAAEFAQLWGPRLTTDQQSLALAKLLAEADNFRAAILWGQQQKDAETVLRLTTGLWRLLEIKGLYQDGSKRLRMAMSLPGAENLHVLRSEALQGLSTFSYRQGDLDASEACSLERLELEREYGAKAGIADALNDLGNVAQLRGDYAKAHDLYSQSLAIQRELQAARGIAVALFNSGRQATNLELFDEARTNLEESLRMFEAANNDREAAFALNGLAQLALHAGVPYAAERYADRALAIRERLGDKRGTADSMRIKADVFIGKGNFAAAADLLTRSGDTAISIGDERGLAETLEHLAWLNSALGLHGQSVVLYGAAEQLRRKLRLPIPPVDFKARQGRLDAARDAVGQDFDARWNEGGWTRPEDAFALGTNRKAKDGDALS